MSIYMQYAPFKLKGSDWESQRVPLGERWSRRWRNTRPTCRS